MRPLSVPAILASALSVRTARSFRPPTFSAAASRAAACRASRCELRAAPRRLEENAGGVLYVDDRCINCAACSHFAPTLFDRSDDVFKHIVYRQPAMDEEEVRAARTALAACPVAAIRVEDSVHSDDERELKEALSVEDDRPFPKMMYPMMSEDGELVDMGVYYLGHHNDATFGAMPYLVQGKSREGQDISVMVDVPRFGPSAVRAVTSMAASGPDYMFLTHVDDTADHSKWKKEFPALRRIFHSGDLGRHNWIGDLALEDVEVLLQKESEGCPGDGLETWDIDGNPLPSDKLDHLEQGEFRILHTPGHSPGSICLLYRPQLPISSSEMIGLDGKKVKYPNGVLFTGDTYAWTTQGGGHMSGFPRYGNNLPTQAASLQKLVELSRMWDVVAPGHGHPRIYLDHDIIADSGEGEIRKLNEMNGALEELLR